MSNHPLAVQLQDRLCDEAEVEPDMAVHMLGDVDYW